MPGGPGIFHNLETTEKMRADAVLPLLVRTMTWESPDVLSLSLAHPEGEQLPSWQAGAHIDISIEGIGTAQYSLCGTLDAVEWRIAVLHQREGKGVSRYIHKRLRPGERVLASAPKNLFQLDPAPAYLFIAGGIGITPFLPMIEAANSNGRPWSLAYGGRSVATMSFIPALHTYGSAVRFFPADSCGLIPVSDLLASSPTAAVYCCGPEPLIQAVQAACAAAGREAPHIERFGAAAPAAPRGPDQHFSIVLARTGITLDVPPGRSIADVLEAHGVFVPTSCREGVCGSCETRVLSGEVEHRDSLLSEEEHRRGETMMVCVSRACGAKLTLDV